MKPGGCWVALISLAAGGCPPPRASYPGQTTARSEGPGRAKHVSRESPAGDRARAARALRAGIRAYNDGRTAEAREHLGSALRETRGSSRAAPGSSSAVTRSGLTRIRAEVHFYLAAVAWDLRETHGVTYHLKLCRHVDPSYEPADWTCISPGLRKRFESLK